MAFGLVTAFTDHVRIVTTSMYSAIGNSHAYCTTRTNYYVCCVSTDVLG
jgi:hypothetical protein